MKIAIVRLSAMGDIFHMLWCIKNIRNAYPNAKIDFFVDSRFYFLAEDLIWFDEVFSIPFKKHPLKSIKMIFKHKNNYDISIDYQGRVKSAFIANVLSKNSFGYAKNGLKEKLAYYFYKHHCDCDYLENVYTRSLELSKFALDKFDSDIKLSDVLIYKDEKTKQYEEKIKDLIKEDFILLHNGSSKISKMYPIEGFIDICKLYGNKFYLAWGNDYELNRAKQIAKECPNAIVLPKLCLNELIFLSKHAKLILGNDSGTTHLGVVLNIANITFLNENKKKPAKRLLSPSNKHYYFYRFDEVDIEQVSDIINKALKNE